MRLRDTYKRVLRSIGWWLADGALQRLNQPDAKRGLGNLDQGLTSQGVLEQLEAIRVHTWLSKEHQAMYFEDQLTIERLKQFGQKIVAKHNTHLFSQTYEDATISEIFARVGATSRTFIEVGAGDGRENTTRLLLKQGWTGLWIEGERQHVDRIQQTFRDDIQNSRLKVICAFVTVENIQSLIDQAQLGREVDLISIDIDQNTSHVWRAITTRARVACVEYNAHFPPSTDYEVPYEASRAWDGSNFFGASLKALERLGSTKEMSLVGCDLMGVNAYFVADNLLGDKFLAPYSAEQHYCPPRYPFVRGQRGHRRADQ